MSKSSNHGAQSPRSKTDFSHNPTYELFDKLSQCNNLTIRNVETNTESPITIEKVGKDNISVNKVRFDESQNETKFFDPDYFKPPESVIHNSPLSSRLAFLLAKVSLRYGMCKKDITVLHDSGCAKTILSYDIFRQFPDNHKLGLRQAPNLRVESFDGSQSQIVGVVDLFIQFTGSNGIEATFLHEVLVHKATTHDLMLGRDFTGKELDYKICETN